MKKIFAAIGSVLLVTLNLIQIKILNTTAAQHEISKGPSEGAANCLPGGQ